MFHRVIYKLASRFLSDQSLLSILMLRGYTNMTIKRSDGSGAYQTEAVGRMKKVD